MRIVIDLQGAQTESRFHGIGRYSLSLSLAIAQHSRDHEIWLLLNGAYAESALALRREFAGLVPPDRIVMFYPTQELRQRVLAEPARLLAAEAIREHVLLGIDPDCILVTSLFESSDSDAVTGSAGQAINARTAVILYDLIPLLNPDFYLADRDIHDFYHRKVEVLRDARLLLAISESSRSEAHRLLDVPQERLATIMSAADERFRPTGDAPAATLARYGITRKIVLYSPSGYDPRKNIDALIEAFGQLDPALRGQYQLVVTSKFTIYETELIRSLAARFLAPDDLVLTGFAPDEDLVILYSVADLFVYPSRHEGFGLPALEAMCCGAPVIGSNRTSIPEVIGLPEALFDPDSTSEMTAAIERALTDEVWRENLRTHGLSWSKQFSWGKSAERALDAIEAAFSPPTKPADPTNLAVRRRLAFVSPLPPQRSGISGYSVDLLSALIRQFDITLVSEAQDVELPDDLEHLPIQTPEWFAAKADSFDDILYHFGNSHFHTFMIPLLRLWPGVVVLHDFFLSGLFWTSQASGTIPHAWDTAMLGSHGDVTLREPVAGDITPMLDKYPANLSVLNGATGVIVHSEYSKQLTTQWYGRTDLSRIRVVPMVRTVHRQIDREGARAALGISPETFLICSFGQLHPTKLNLELLAAWLAAECSSDARCELHFVGECPGELHAASVAALVARSPAGRRVKITGWAAAEEYLRYLDAADVAVQLRSVSRGETSAAVLDCLNHGVPTIVNANGALAEFPDGTVRVLRDRFAVGDLSAALDDMYAQVSHREQFGQAGRELIQSRHRPEQAAAEYVAALDHFRADVDRRSHRTHLLRDIIERTESHGGTNHLRDIAQALARSVNAPVRPQQILVEISRRDLLDEQITALITGTPKHVRLVFVRHEDCPAKPHTALHRVPGFPGAVSASRQPVDLHAGDVLLIPDCAALESPGYRQMIAAAQSAGVRIAAIARSAASAQAGIPLIDTHDVGIICASAEDHRTLQQRRPTAEVLPPPTLSTGSREKLFVDIVTTYCCG